MLVDSLNKPGESNLGADAMGRGPMILTLRITLCSLIDTQGGVCVHSASLSTDKMHKVVNALKTGQGFCKNKVERCIG